MCHSLKIDAKGRLKIPAHLLSAALGMGNEFYVTSNDGTCVRIYPLKVWQEVEEQLEGMSLHNPTCQRLLARVKYFGQSVKTDKQGRLLIPKGLRNTAKMKGDVDVLSYTHHLEVWNHHQLLRDLYANPISVHGEVTLDALISSRRSAWSAARRNEGETIQKRERRFEVHRRPSGNSRSRLNHSISGERNHGGHPARVA